MAVICDICPHEKDGKFNLDEAKLAVVMVKLKGDHPTEHKAGCEDHVLEAIEAVGDQPGKERSLAFWTDFEIMRAN
jgi:hypothetical protein